MHQQPQPLPLSGKADYKGHIIGTALQGRVWFSLWYIQDMGKCKLGKRKLAKCIKSCWQRHAAELYKLFLLSAHPFENFKTHSRAANSTLSLYVSREISVHHTGIYFVVCSLVWISRLHNLGTNHHWVCSRSRKGAVIAQVLDSVGLFKPLNLSTVLQMAQIYSVPTDQSVIEIQKLSVQQQHGTVDCGLFSVSFMVEMCLGCPQNVSFDQNVTTFTPASWMELLPKMLSSELLPRPSPAHHRVKAVVVRLTGIYDLLWCVSRRVPHRLCKCKSRLLSRSVEMLLL